MAQQDSGFKFIFVGFLLFVLEDHVTSWPMRQGEIDRPACNMAFPTELSVSGVKVQCASESVEHQDCVANWHHDYVYRCPQIRVIMPGEKTARDVDLVDSDMDVLCRQMLTAVGVHYRKLEESGAVIADTQVKVTQAGWRLVSQGRSSGVKMSNLSCRGYHFFISLPNKK